MVNLLNMINVLALMSYKNRKKQYEEKQYEHKEWYTYPKYSYIYIYY